MKKSVIKLSALVMLAIFSSCSADKDTEKPTIQIISPVNESEFEIGDNISIQFTFTDNEALKSYKIDIHENDGHTHEPRPNNANGTPFEYEMVENISGRTFSKTVVVTIPADTELAEYHLGIFAIDAAGNEQEKFIDFHIE
jgi:hypothetical protein